MRVKAKLNSYEDTEFAITTTAKVSDWRTLIKQVESITAASRPLGWPLSGYVACARKMLEDLDKTHADALLREDQTFTS